MIQIDRETFQMMLHQIMERFDKIEDKLGRMNRQTSALDGDKLLDNQDMCELLGITKRTLARYRQKKTRDLLHDRRAYLLQIIRGQGVSKP